MAPSSTWHAPPSWRFFSVFVFQWQRQRRRQRQRQRQRHSDAPSWTLQLRAPTGDSSAPLCLCFVLSCPSIDQHSLFVVYLDLGNFELDIFKNICNFAARINDVAVILFFWITMDSNTTSVNWFGNMLSLSLQSENAIKKFKSNCCNKSIYNSVNIAC